MAAISVPLDPVLPAGNGAAATQRVFQLLRDQIVRLELPPLTEMSEGRLAEQLGVSRTPVREALARLAKLQLVDIFPQRGTLVAPLRLPDLLRAQFIRESLELGLLRRALAAPDRDGLVETLRAEIAVQHTLETIGDEARFNQSDALFHQQIALSAGLPQLWGDISDVSVHLDRLARVTLPGPDTLAMIVDQHWAIADAIALGELGDAEAAMKLHLRAAFGGIDSAFAQHPSFFGNKEWPEPPRGWFD